MKNIIDLKKEGKLTKVTHIIYFDNLTTVELESAKQVGITIVKYEDAIAEGMSEPKAECDEVTPDTYYTFSYTSGTTGMPKGVMLTHRNFASNIGAMNAFDPGFTLRDDDVYISYLPLAHVFERMLLMAAMGYMFQYGFFQGDVLKLKEDLCCTQTYNYG